MLIIAQITVFWRFTMYYISPVTYLIGGVLSAVLNKVPVVCNPSELVTFDAPSGQSCGTYSAEFLSTALGYLVNPNATTNCKYCAFSRANGVSN
jgi:ATP-binding cassette, subfamily G (WHITE), member 2, SNQ2